MYVGLRVIRGPDWSSGECDGGEGHLGTVALADNGQGMVDVIWDNGQRRRCLAGENNKHELLIFDNATVGIRHNDVTCSECGEQGIFGMRWSCQTCTNIDLCSICYVRDKHALGHPFKRHEYPSGNGEEVKKRNTSLKIQAMGIFPNAKVVRGDDWKWGNQDGGQGSKGIVQRFHTLESTSSTRNVVVVKWPQEKIGTHIYRVGHQGKMDLKFTDESPGTHYYRDHLPVLDVTKALTSSMDQGHLEVGDRVCIDVTEEELRSIQSGSGAAGWSAGMAQCIGKFGTVKGFSPRGDVIVSFDTTTFRIHPQALRKAPKYSVGDIVKILNDQEKVEVLQQRHGGWNNNMKKVLGKVGKVVKVQSADDVVVGFGTKVWVFNPACCIPAPGATTFDVQESSGEVEIEIEGITGLNEMLLRMLGGLLVMQESQGGSVRIDDLYQAIAKGNVQGVKSILDKKKSLLAESHKGVTPLVLACHEGKLDMVKMMLDTGARLENRDHRGNTPLIAALIGKRELVCKLLIQQGANVKAHNKQKQTCVHLACWANLHKVLTILIEMGCNINAQDESDDTPLHDAIQERSNECTEILLGDQSVNLTLVNHRGFTALHLASLRGNVFAVNKIIQTDGSTVDLFRPRKDYTALHIAAANDHVEIARLLIEKGSAQVDSQGEGNGRSPLHIACTEAYYRTVELLMQKGANPNITHTESGNAALHLAIGSTRSGSTGEMPHSEIEARMRIACFLLENQAVYNHKNVKGKTPLETAANSTLKNLMELYMKKNKRALKARPPTAKPGGRRAATAETQTLFNLPLPCSKCFASMSDVTLQPCGHKVLCRNCCVKVQLCPMCETRIERREAADSVDVEEACKMQ